MNRILLCALNMCLSAVMYGQAQPTAFDSFVSRINKQYKVDIALSPELIPVIDSILDSGTRITTIDELLQLLVHEEHLTYQIVDGNKLMLRKEIGSGPTQGVATIEGTIIDQERLPLAYAAVHVLNSTRGCQTDEHGHFSLLVTDTMSIVQVDYLGYEPVQKKISEFLNGPVTVSMKIRENPLEEVTIVIPYKEVYQDHVTQSLNLTQYALISETQLLQWNGERLLTTLTSYSQYSSDEGIRIRGAEPKNSLFLMDEIPVYNPYHYYNIFSPFNPNYFSSVKLYKNNLPVAYGGRIDGMIQLNSEQDKQRDHLIIESDLLLSAVEGRLGLGDKFSLGLGGRISHTGILKKDLRDSSVTNYPSKFGRFKSEKEFETVQQPTFNFYDINAGLEGHVGSKSHLYLNGYSSNDKLNTTSTAELTTTFQNYETVNASQLYINDDQWRNAGFSTGFSTSLTPKTSLSIDGFFSHYEKEETYTSVINEERNFMNHYEDHTMTNVGLLDSKLNHSGIKGTLKKDISSSASFETGLDLNQYRTKVQAKENYSTYLSQSQKEFETTLFGNYQFWLSHHFLFDLGSRLTHLNQPSNFYLLPNVMATYFIGEKVNVRMAYSQSVQALHELTIVNRFGREMDALILNDKEEEYPVMRADKYMLGGGYSTQHFSFDAEFYYKKLDGLMRVTTLQPDPGFNDQTPPWNFYRLFTGTGWTAGMDLTAYFKKGRTDFVASYTLSKIAEQYDKFFDGKEFSPQEDRRHQVKFSGRYKMGHFDFSGLITYKSKAPYLSYIKVEDNDHHYHEQHGIQMAPPEAVFDYLPEFFSLDFGLDYSFKLYKQHAMVGISLINATDHANVEEIINIGRIDRDEMDGLFLTQKTELLGRTWNVRFRIMF